MKETESIEEMSLDKLKVNVTELPEEQLLAYLNSTRNNRLKPTPKKAKKKKEKVEAEDQLVALLRELGPGAIEELARMMEGSND